ncbi:hypothetical protein [Paenibacillus sp. UMB4589-SE434]|uniref:XkdQ/YqbQ family protein n=1 Tax=Paenibacillus sp. UMB4589-SE434 TaxID=3046314 RepID=UPI002551A41A|nr:hypothetical protein [Paenibacillus sp. UMB4589-SE434]MDK8183701.1 hypothetical protein [Paenibacillus sp. UMB4589-SE434]
MKLIHTSRDGNRTNITELITRMTWSGTLSEAARKLEWSVLVSDHDYYIANTPIDLGEMVTLYAEDDSELFRGYVFRKGKSLTGTEISYNAYDGLIYLLKSTISMKFEKLTAGSIVKLICKELNLQVGVLPESDFPISFVHMGKSAYEAIMVAYTQLSKKTGKLYIPRMQEGKVVVVTSGDVIADRLMSSASNLLEAQYDEDIESMINSVRVTDQNGTLIKQIVQEDWIQKYGKLQATVQQEEQKDNLTLAKEHQNGIQRTASAQVLGGHDALDMITGHMVMMNHGILGRTGLFFVSGDTHTFESGQHLIQLELQFNKMMDERTAE